MGQCGSKLQKPFSKTTLRLKHGGWTKAHRPGPEPEPGPRSLQDEDLTNTKGVLLETLKDLGEDEFKEFKWQLQQRESVCGFPAIPKSELEKADRIQTVDQIVQTYVTETNKVTRNVLGKINRNDLVRTLSGTSSTEPSPSVMVAAHTAVALTSSPPGSLLLETGAQSPRDIQESSTVGPQTDLAPQGEGSMGQCANKPQNSKTILRLKHGGRTKAQRPESPGPEPGPSCVSTKSNRSIGFKDEQQSDDQKVLQGENMTLSKEGLLEIMENLGDDDIEKFKSFLQDPNTHTEIPNGLENASLLEIVNLLMKKYKTGIEEARKFFAKINRNDLVMKLPKTVTGPKASRKPHRPETEEDLDQSSASGEALQPGLEASNKALMDPGGEQRLTHDDLKKYSCELTLDTNTVNRYLTLSDNNRKVTRVEEEQPYPDHPERFDFWCQLLCSNGLTGHCYWEVEWSGRVCISVSYRGISRKGSSTDSVFGGNDQSWSLICSDGGGYSVRHNDRVTRIPSTSVSNRVAVYVDCPAGSLSFYSVSSDSLIHLHTFNTTFTEPLSPGFGIGPPDASVSLCDV